MKASQFKRLASNKNKLKRFIVFGKFDDILCINGPESRVSIQKAVKLATLSESVVLSCFPHANKAFKCKML